jgi:dihydrofolate reductase
MATIRGYIATSLDGCIASPDGGIDWLRKYDGVDMGAFAYDRFIAGIRTVVMGRTTYDDVLRLDIGWPYSEKRAFVVTSRPIAAPAGPLETWSAGVPALIARLRALDDGDVWLIGGGRLQQAFIAAGALDRMELFIVPEIVGGGIPLFPPNGFARTLTLSAVDRLGGGCVRLLYDFA